LLNQGYSRTTVEKAMDMAQKQLAASVPMMEEKPKVTYEVIDEENMKKKVSDQDIASRGFFSRTWHKIFG
jgi:SOS response regulatory protein OraA/RecX